MSERFDGLTAAQENALMRIAFPLNDWMARGGGAQKGTLAELLRRGLIEAREERLPGWPPVTVTTYEMPLAEHIRLCAWCADVAAPPVAP